MTNLTILLKNFPLEQYLQQRSLEYKTRERYLVLEVCANPACGKERKMAIYLDFKNYSCFSCGSKGSFFDFMVLVEGISKAEAVQRLVNKKTFTSESSLNMALSEAVQYRRTIFEDIEELPEIELPKWYRPIVLTEDNEFSRYLRGRGFTQEDVDYADAHYSQGEQRVIFPIQDHVPRLVGWQARDITGLTPLKIITKPDDVKKTFILYNWWRFCDEDMVTLVEGPVDAIKARLCNGVAILGKEISNKQLALIMSNRNLKTVNIGFDPNAPKQIRDLAKQLSAFYDINIVAPPKGREDIGACTVDEAVEAVTTALPYWQYADSFGLTL